MPKTSKNLNSNLPLLETTENKCDEIKESLVKNKKTFNLVCKKRIFFFRIFVFQFSSSTALDYFLIIVGTFASVVHGAGFPLLSIVLGGMTSGLENF